jgi:hypothetical protein
MGADESDALLDGGAGPVPDWTPSSRRKWQDTKWLLWWLTNFALALAWGGMLATEQPVGDPAAHLAAYSTCNGAAAAAGSRRRLLGASDASAALVTTAGILAGVACVCAVAAGIGSIYALKNEAITKVCVYGAIGVQITVAAALGLFCLMAGNLWPALFLLLYAGVFGLCAWCYAAQLKLCCKLLSLAAHALCDNLVLIPATLASFLAGALLIFVPVGALVVTATRVGSAYPATGAVLSTLSGAAPGTCMAPLSDVDGGLAPAPAPAAGAAAAGVTMVAADCCAFQLAGASIGYLVFCFFFLLWSLFILFEIRSFVCAHVTSRWYYQPRGVPLPGRPVLHALQLSVGPAAGSLCFGGAVLTCAELIRMLADAVRSSGEDRGIVMVIIDAIIAGILDMIAEFLSAMTRFATIRVAITGETFWEGAGAATELFKRNWMNAVAVWSFPPMVLHLIAFTISVLFAGVAVLIFSADALAVGATGTTGALGLQLGLLLFLGVALLFWLVLSYVSCILLNVVDCMYYCYVLDIDKRQVTRNDVHELYEMVPGIKTISNPDGGMGIAGP